MSPIVYSEELTTGLNVTQLLSGFERDAFLLVFDGGTTASAASLPPDQQRSAAWLKERGYRYSFLTADPIDICTVERCEHGDDPFAVPRRWQARFPASGFDRELPPFAGGIAGLMSYELGHAFEKLPAPAKTGFTTPPLVAGLFDWAIVHDHLSDRIHVYVMRLDGNDRASMSRQQDRIHWIHERLRRTSSSPIDVSTTDPRVPPASTLEAGPRHSVERLSGVTSNFTIDGYESSVQRVIDYIAAGDIYQANLSQQLLADWGGAAADLFRSVRQYNTAPFCALMQTDQFAVVSASPERFLLVENGRRVVTRPIKGTRRRHRSPIADLYTSDELSASEKDRAENVMIVDLLRNDISRVCRTGSVRVTGVCEIEVFETVQHLVSTIEGELRPDRDIWDLCAACFPGGSVTGAPRIRAMQIIAELERVARGAYCGSLFYSGPRGDFDSSILIRTFTLRDGEVSFPVGGGVVADSIPRDEYEETLHKASGMMKALRAGA